MSEENKVIDKVNTSEIVEQPVDAEEIPPVKTEAIQRQQEIPIPDILFQVS